MADSFIDFPFGEADVLTPTSAATLEVEVKKRMTVLKPTTLGANMTLNLAIHAELKKGAILVLLAGSDGTARSVTFGTGFTAPVLAGTISKKKTQSFCYDGTAFLPMGASLQID